MVKDVVNFISKKIQKTLEHVEKEEFNAGKYPHAKSVDDVDICAVIDLIYF